MHRVVLLGFMASGKTAVGRELSDRLQWRYVDLDTEIERRTGRSIEQIFATLGETAFRSLEVRLTSEFIRDERLVFSPGGGWITNPGVLGNLPPDTLTVWLQVSPDIVLRRLAAKPGQPVRPLLRSPDPELRVRELLALREPLYAQSMVTIRTDELTVGQIVDLLEDYIRHGRTVPGALDTQSRDDQDEE